MNLLTQLPRTRLMMAAEGLFQMHGFHATGIDLIVREAGAAKASLYQHFSSKDALVSEVLRQKSRTVLGWLNSEIARLSGGQPDAAIDALFDAYAAWFEESSFNGCLFSKAALEYPDKAHPAHRAAAAHTRKLFRTLEDLCRDAGIPAPGAETLLILLEGSVEVAAKTGAGRAPAMRAKENARRLFAP